MQVVKALRLLLTHMSMCTLPVPQLMYFQCHPFFHNCKCVICSWHTTCRFASLPDIIRILNALHSVSEFLKASKCLAALNQYYKRSQDQDTLNPGIIYSKCMKIRCKILSANLSCCRTYRGGWGAGSWDSTSTEEDSMKRTGTWSKNTVQTEKRAVKCGSTVELLSRILFM